MFGYIRINKPELKVKEFEIYNALYCGLCRHLGKNYGVLSKLCLSYDMTFVSLLQAAVTDGCDCFEQRSCRVNPLKKCTYCKNDRETQELAAAASMAMCDMKLRDEIADRSLLLSLLSRFLRLLISGGIKKAYKKYPELESIVSSYEAEQLAAESTESCTLDLAAEPSAKAIGRILSIIKCDEKYKFILQRMGYCLGKWVYLCDAADDLCGDIKKHRFNPLIPELPAGADPKRYAEQRLVPLMNNCIIECANYSELLDIKKYKPILDNILYEGLKIRQKQIFKEEKVK